MQATLTNTVDTTVVTNYTVRDIVTGILEGENGVEAAKKILHDAKRTLADWLGSTPVLYEAVMQGETISGLLALAGYQCLNPQGDMYRDDQQFRYYVITGEVLSRLAKDKTAPSRVNWAVNRIADTKRYPGFTKKVSDNLIANLAESNGTWGDYVKAVESYAKSDDAVKDQAAVDHTVINIGRYTPGQIAALENALATLKK